MSIIDTFILPRSGRYANPTNQNDILPILYGDLTENSATGIFIPPCIDTINQYYCLCASEILSENNGNVVKVYNNDVLLTSGYTVITDGDLENQGRIAYLAFDEIQSGTITVSCSGRASAGILITNPIDIAEDLLSLAGDSTSYNIHSFSQAKYSASFYNYVAAGIINSDNSLFFWIVNILSSFLGEAFFNNRGELVLMIDTPLSSTIQISGNIRERNCSGWSGVQSIKNLINIVPVNYAKSYTKIDLRYTEDVKNEYLKEDNGESTQDAFSVKKFGVFYPKTAFTFDWCRKTENVRKIQARTIEKHSKPIWFPISTQELGFENIHVEEGDFVTYSWEGRRDENGYPLRNQIAEVLTKRIDGDFENIQWELRDTGTYLSEPPDIWDGSTYTGDGGIFGGKRDRRIL